MSSEDLLDCVKSMSKEGAYKMGMEKITPDLVLLMSDEELKNYLPVHGDRLRLRQHLKNDDQSNRKNKLLKVLHKKVDKAKTKKIKHQGSIRRQRARTTCVERMETEMLLKALGMLKLGGFTKYIKEQSKYDPRLEEGLEKFVCARTQQEKKVWKRPDNFFFPDGESKKGKLEDLNYDMWDFSERKLKSDITIQKMYEETKMPMLRFYLATWDKNKDEDAVAPLPGCIGSRCIHRYNISGPINKWHYGRSHYR
ncbi:unnamed protein product [Mytilus coruscus]|uniref:SAM domain-containing protein n=1 Tax=Mytilus coruscus TaxID=42192 RepID=A0A6J8CYC0_MYTCO|nr:unnamed protein product [Mytilus coruscus]